MRLRMTATEETLFQATFAHLQPFAPKSTAVKLLTRTRESPGARIELRRDLDVVLHVAACDRLNPPRSSP